MSVIDLGSFGNFPSAKHRELLVEKMQTAKFNAKEAFPDPVCRRQWHAYDYGWRRFYLSNRQPSSPIDPYGEWFDAALADRAEDFFRGAPRSQPRITPADQVEMRGDHAEAARLREQLARLREANDDVELSGDGSGKNPDGSPTKQALAKVDLCMEIIRDNKSRFVDRNTKAKPPPAQDDGEELRALQASMGIRATEER